MITLEYGRNRQAAQRWTEQWNFLEVAMVRASDLLYGPLHFDWVEVYIDTDIYGESRVCHAVMQR